MYEFDGYDEILKCYEGETDIHASTSFEVGLELFILIGGCYALYTVGMAIATELDYRALNKKREGTYDT